MRDLGGERERKPWRSRGRERKGRNLRKTKGKRNWIKTNQRQYKTAAKMERVDQNEPPGAIVKIFNPLGRMENRSGGW